MKNKKFKLTFLGAVLCFALTGCSNDDSTDSTNNYSESGVVSNDEVTLTYGSSLLKHYYESNNASINLTNGYSARSGSQLPTYQNQSVTDAINLLTLDNNSNVNTQSGSVYYIPVDESFSGNINLVSGVKLIIKGSYTGTLNFNGASEIYVEGNLSAASQINVPANGKIIVGPNATFGNQTIHLNSNAQLDNYGDYTYKSNTLDGIIENYKTLTFNGNGNLNVNGNSVVKNHCQVKFEKATEFNGKFYNNSKATFEKGFSINGSGRIFLAESSYVNVKTGTISISGLVENPAEDTVTSRARIDIASVVSVTNMNATSAFKGGIDINTELSATQLKIGSGVVLNYDTYIATTDCMNVNLGLASCTASSIKLDYSGMFTSPVVNNITLSATDVRVLNGKAYVSYHTNDEEFDDSPYGSVRVFDITNVTEPVLIAQADFNKAEFNSIEIHNNTLYAVGNNKAGAIMYSVPLNDGMFTNDLNAIKSNSLPSLSAKNIHFNGSDIWLATSGLNGGLIKLNSDFTFNSNIDDSASAKYIASNANNFVYLALDQGKPYLRYADNNGGLLFGGGKTYSNINLNVTDGKNTLAFDTDLTNKFVYAALSDQGVAKFDLTNGNLVSRFIPNEFRGLNGYKVLKKNGRTNAVTVDGCFVYIANGADGVVALNKNTMEYAGHFTLENQKSANFVYAKDGYLFVATGRSGLEIIKID